MTTFRSEEGLVGFVAGAVVLPWIVWIVFRSLGSGALPIGRSYVSRQDRPAAYWVLFAFYAGSGAMALVICLDLLFGMKLKS